MSQEASAPAPSAAESASQNLQESIETAAEEIAGTGEEVVEEQEEEQEESVEVAAEGEESEEGEESSDEKLEAAEEEIKQLKKKLKLKVDGQEIEEEIDFEDDEALIKNLQKAKAFDKKAQESAEYRKQMEGLLGALRENPAAVLQELGMDVNQMAYDQLNAYLEEEKKSPEQKRLEEIERERDSLKAEKERLAEEKATAEEQRLRDEAASQIQEDILGTLKEHTGIMSADDPEAIGDIARAMFRYAQAGQDVEVKDVIKTVENRYVEKLRKRAENWDEATFNKIFGKKKMSELRKKRVATKKVKTQTAKQVAETGKTAPKEPEKAPEKKSYRDFFKYPGH